MKRISLATIIALCFCGVAAAQEETVWITMGEDVFDRLARTPGLLGHALTLESFGADAGVVITRLPARDLQALATFIHSTTRRCGGFIVHDSLAEAEAALEAAARGSYQALASSFQVGYRPLVEALLPELQKPEIFDTIQHLSTAYNNRYYVNLSGQQAALWIRDLWQGYAAGRPDATVETWDHGGYIQPSVILTIDGATLPAEVVVLGGHLDSVVSGADNTDPATLAPGADDNASGIAALSEALRVLLEKGVVPDRTVKFMGYAAEEVGLLGSGDIAAAFSAAGTNVVAVLQLDMTDFNGSVEDIVLIDDYTNTELTSFVIDLVEAYQPELLWTYTSCGYACSDHASWHNEGYPAAFSFEARFGEHNPFIHTANDTLATLGNSVDHALKFAKVALSFAVETGMLDCTADPDCDDGLFCTGIETCVAGVCQPGSDPCGGGACDEAGDVCTSVCGDGTCDAGEDCTSCPADCPSFPIPGVACGNGLCEAGDGEDCATCPEDCNGVQGGKPSGRFCCGFGGTNPVGCGDARCTTGGFACTEDPVGSGGTTCCGDLACESPEDGFNCPLDCGAPPECGDGTCDEGEDECSCAADCGAPPATEAGLCGDGVDNDCDALTDCADPDCDSACQVDCSQYTDKQSCNAQASCRWDNRNKVCVPV